MRMLDLQSCCSPRKLETEIFLFLEINSLEITSMLLCLKRNGTDVIYRSSSFRCIQFNITHTHLTFEDHKVPSAPHSFEIPEDYDFILTPSITTFFFSKSLFISPNSLSFLAKMQFSTASVMTLVLGLGLSVHGYILPRALNKANEYPEEKW